MLYTRGCKEAGQEKGEKTCLPGIRGPEVMDPVVCPTPDTLLCLGSAVQSQLGQHLLPPCCSPVLRQESI